MRRSDGTRRKPTRDEAATARSVVTVSGASQSSLGLHALQWLWTSPSVEHDTIGEAK